MVGVQLRSTKTSEYNLSGRDQGLKSSGSVRGQDQVPLRRSDSYRLSDKAVACVHCRDKATNKAACLTRVKSAEVDGLVFRLDKTMRMD